MLVQLKLKTLSRFSKHIFSREFPWINHNFFFSIRTQKKLTEYTIYLYRSLPQISQCWLQFNAWLNYMSPCSCFFLFFFFLFLKCIFILSNYSGSLIEYTRVTYTEKSPHSDNENRIITEKNKKGKAQKNRTTDCKRSHNFHFIENHHECV